MPKQNTRNLIYSLPEKKVLSKHLRVIHVPAQEQCTGLLIKALSPSRFAYLGSKLRVCDVNLQFNGSHSQCAWGEYWSIVLE